MITRQEIRDAVEATMIAKANKPSIAVTLMGRTLFEGIKKEFQVKSQNALLVLMGTDVVVSDVIPTSHCLYFSTVADANELKQVLGDVIKEVSWNEIVEAFRDSRKWDEIKMRGRHGSREKSN